MHLKTVTLLPFHENIVARSSLAMQMKGTRKNWMCNDAGRYPRSGSGLQLDNVGGLRSLFALDDVEFDSLSFV